ncbi:TrlF family AAA-like ATPase [Allomesorhizobium alhagi]|uniref:PHP domain protein n=1 Tax=Mesorhizobium alhagi CCNWXJ12-2 TaxID=1107882 RepID=H0HQA9_9HYPH|nr:phosphoesterase [Mesorhizobium alhagi]EHK57081.1 PHP domain protein [Mesorhizobium alhagi CCNWXJ12-2]
MTAEAIGLARPLSDRMQAALNLPNGARFYRCALQVNPFAYLERHNKPTTFTSEDEYNKAIIKTCLDVGIEVIAVTDHYRVKHSGGLVRAARNAGLFAFAGFEAVTKDGVHFLCLFDPDKDEVLERFIGECGIHETDHPSPIGSKDSTELLESSKKWGAVCIAAHVASEGGLLKKLSGQSRVNVWTNPDLLACALPGPVSDAPDGIRPILENKDVQHRRDHTPAILNASDVNDPEDVIKDGASCFIKMSTVSVEGFRQAFLDPESRIRLHCDPKPESHAEFLAMTWEGGFLRDTAVHFNENLNVLVGGRGTGKSTIIESIRYALGLDPLGDEARKAHEGTIRHVLQPGTKVSLLVRSHKPSERCYLIERSVPNPPVVKSEAGEVLSLSPRDVMPDVEVFGQHEISELTKSPEKLTLLLERFVDRDPSLLGRKSKVRLELERSRSRIVDVRREMKRLEDRLASLPGLEETQKRFQQAGLEERLKEKSLLIREERLFSNLEERLDQYRTLQNELIEGLPVDTAFVSGKALEGLPNVDILAGIERILGTLSTHLKAIGDQFAGALAEADRAIAETKSGWNERRETIEETYEKLLRELQKSKIDGAGFIQLRKQIEELRPLKDKTENLRRDLEAHEAQRRNLLAEWEDIKAAEYREIETAAKRVSRRLRDRVQVKVAMAGNREPLEQLLREVGGNLAAALDRLQSQDQLSLPELAQRCREGKESLMKHYNLPSGAAERIAQADRDLFMRIEELELPATTQIELNTAPEDEPPVWRTLQALSTGQKATAVLLLLLLESEAPLVVDQPEDDLDNRFITEGVVPIMRQEKRRRQFVFSTHNANIPVLGDAELILGLAATGEAREGHAKIATEHMGSIDSEPVRELVEEILEGGKAAFEMRRSKYGF